MSKFPIGLWLDGENFDRLDRRAVETGLPVSTYARLLVLAALDAGLRPKMPVGPLRQPGRRETRRRRTQDSNAPPPAA